MIEIFLNKKKVLNGKGKDTVLLPLSHSFHRWDNWLIFRIDDISYEERMKTSKEEMNYIEDKRMIEEMKRADMVSNENEKERGRSTVGIWKVIVCIWRRATELNWPSHRAHCRYRLIREHRLRYTWMRFSSWDSVFIFDCIVGESISSSFSFKDEISSLDSSVSFILNSMGNITNYTSLFSLSSSHGRSSLSQCLNSYGKSRQ